MRHRSSFGSLRDVEQVVEMIVFGLQHVSTAAKPVEYCVHSLNSTCHIPAHSRHVKLVPRLAYSPRHHASKQEHLFNRSSMFQRQILSPFTKITTWDSTQSEFKTHQIIVVICNLSRYAYQHRFVGGIVCKRRDPSAYMYSRSQGCARHLIKPSF